MRSTLALAIAMAASPAAADTGIVIAEGVCGSDKSIIATTTGWFVAAEWYGGQLLSKDYAVFGKLMTYGFEDVQVCMSRSVDSCRQAKIYIEDFEANVQAAVEELCK